MKTIGFVCEGPRDYELLSAVVKNILQEEIRALPLQPEDNLCGDLGNGWKGVLKWCEKQGPILDLFMDGAVPKIDMLVIQMDGDVSRKEKEVHCACGVDCSDAGQIDPLRCEKIAQNACPVMLPCVAHEDGIKGYVSHLNSLLRKFMVSERVPVYAIPCDSTDAWIVAACDELENIESIENPWESIISVKKDYHGIRIHGHKKIKSEYAQLIPFVCNNWRKVTETCSQAKAFDDAIRKTLV